MVELDSRALRIVEACLDLDGADREGFIDRESGGSAALAKAEARASPHEMELWCGPRRVRIFATAEGEFAS